MKKLLLTLCFFATLTPILWAQCVPSCSTYVLSSINYSQFPTTGNSLNSAFSPNGDDGLTGAIPIGFNFNFYCGTYSQVIVGSNGFLTFDVVNYINPATSQTSQFFPNSNSPNGMVCFNWNDLDPSAGGAVTFTTIGTSPNQMFILTYTNVPVWNTSLLNSGQIVLYESSDIIEVHSALISQSPYLGTQGIENMTGTAGLAVSGWNNATWSCTNTAYRWQKAVVGAPPTGITGNTLVCFGDSLVFSANSMSTASSYSWSLPGGWAGSSTTTAITATAGVSGNLSVTATYTCGVSAPAIISVTVNPPPFISVSNVSPPSICSGSLVTFNASGGSNYTVNPGGITGTSPFTITAAANTVYSVIGQSALGCVNHTAVTVPLTVYQSPTVTVNSGSICLGASFTFSPTGANTYSYSTLFNQVTPSAIGTYSYLIIGSTGNCSGFANSTVSVNPLPSTSAAASRTAMCVKESVTLTTSGAVTYTWLNTNSNSTLIPVSPLSTTIYTVNGASAAGCIKTATLAVVVNPCTGINEQEADKHFASIYPNPAQTDIQVETDKQATLIIVDASGKEIFSQDKEAGVHHLDLSSFPSGVYLFRLVSGTEQHSFKVIKN